MRLRTKTLCKKIMTFALLIGMIFTGSMSLAQDADGDISIEPSQDGSTPSPSASATGQKAKSSDNRRTTINFEDELVEGSARKPELFYLLQKKQFNYKRLIRLRENFLPEMRRTAEEIQRSGSGD